MANIQNYLNQIKTAVFGKDVRESIHNAIKQCYDDAAVNHDNANMEVKLARGTYNTLNDRLDENEKVQENFSSQLETMESYKVGSVNILNYANFKKDEFWDNALLEATKTNLSIYFPTGIYKFSRGEFILNKGNVIYGDGIGKTKFQFYIDEDVPYIFKYNTLSGVKDIEISVVNTYKNDVLLLDVGYISKLNGGTYHRGNEYILENVKIWFNYASGWGNGLKIKITNFDEKGVIYNSNVRNNLVYFTPSNFEVVYGMKCIAIEGEQRGTSTDNYNQIWMTACSFNRIRANSCVYGLYFELKNSSNKMLLDFTDNKFLDFEVQTGHAGYFASVSHGTKALYIKGLPSPEWKSVFRFNEFTIWDSADGYSGYLENSEIKIVGSHFTRVKNDATHRYGFECISSFVSVDGDYERLRTVNKEGRNTEIRYIDGGISLRSDTEGENGYSAKTHIYEKIIPNTLYSSTIIENYDKNNSIQSTLDIGVKNNSSYMELIGRTDGGIQRPILKTGQENMISSTSKSNKGFYAMNGIWIQYERIQITLPVKTNYNWTTIPFTTVFDGMPFLISANIEYNEHIGQYNIDMRNINVDTKSTLIAHIKHDRQTELTLDIGVVLAGYKAN